MSLKQDVAIYKKIMAINKQFRNTSLKEGDTAFKVGHKVTIVRNTNHSHKSHSIIVMKVSNQPHYKKNNGNANGVHLAYFKDVYFTKHFPSLDIVDVPEVKTSVPNWFQVELNKDIDIGISLADLLPEIVKATKTQVDYQKEILTRKRVGKWR